jgi:hypothetical protein
MIFSGFKNYLDQDKNNEILHICHSEGAINTRNALLLMPENYRNRITVLAIAPAAYISEKLAKEITHYTSDGDFVDKFDLIGRFSNKKNITKLKPHPDANRFFDHTILSPTYNSHIKQYLNNFTKSF